MNISLNISLDDVVDEIEEYDVGELLSKLDEKFCSNSYLEILIKYVLDEFDKNQEFVADLSKETIERLVKLKN